MDYHGLFNHSPIKESFRCFQFGTITNKAAMNHCLKKKNYNCQKTLGQSMDVEEVRKE